MKFAQNKTKTIVNSAIVQNRKNERKFLSFQIKKSIPFGKIDILQNHTNINLIDSGK